MQETEVNLKRDKLFYLVKEVEDERREDFFRNMFFKVSLSKSHLSGPASSQSFDIFPYSGVRLLAFLPFNLVKHSIEIDW